MSSKKITWLCLSLVLSATCILRAQDDIEGLEEQAMKSAVSKVDASVVQIETFGGLEKVGKVLVGTGPTTGLIVSEDGFVISSAFNFAQKPSSILVTLPGGKRAAAEIVSRDNSRMLALLKVKSDQKLTVPEFVSRKDMIVGQWAMAVGRVYDVEQCNLSAGILSARSRIWGKAIQTDAKISPSNYGGPLVDIRGRVLGVLVPLSPRGQGEMAGAEWYDSGIGFAIPLAELLPHLEKMKKGEDLNPGVLGVSLKGNDIYASAAEIAACHGKSPAYKAGLRPGDVIVEVDGQKIVRQAQLKHALGGHYAGDKIKLVALQGKEKKRLEAEIELVDKLEPYEHPFIGFLPRRNAGEKGVVVRHAYSGGPAAEAGLKAGDRVVELDGQEVVDGTALRERLAAFEPEQEVTLKIERDGKPQELKLTLGLLPSDVPGDLPSAYADLEGESGKAPATGVVNIKIPEEKNDCVAYVPENYDTRKQYGVVVWLHPPGGFNQKELLSHWKQRCDDNDLILLAPKASNPSRWSPTEVGFVRKTIDDVVENYNVDPTRIVAHGYQAGGAVAYLLAFGHRDLVRAVAVADSALPARARVPGTDPINRLAIYVAWGEKSKAADRVKAGVKRLKEMKYPVTENEQSGEGGYLSDDELDSLVRWMDSLDRI